jgi:hypothetical protein
MQNAGEMCVPKWDRIAVQFRKKRRNEMQFAKRLLTAFGVIALAALILAVAAPRAVHATVAALVQVVNTATNPAITFEEEAQSAFVVTATCKYSDAPDYFVNVCAIFPLYSVPAGKTAVIESYSAYCETDGAGQFVESKLTFTSPGGSPVVERVPPTSSTTFFGGVVVNEVALNLKSYAAGGASGSVINFEGYANAGQDSTPSCSATLAGHLE